MATTPGRVETPSNTDDFLPQDIQARTAQQPNGSSYSCEWTLTGAVKAIAMLVYSVFKFIVLGLYDYCIFAEDKVIAATQQLSHPTLVGLQNVFNFFVNTFSFWAMFSGAHSASPMDRTDVEADDVEAECDTFCWMTQQIRAEVAANPQADLSRFRLDLVICEGNDEGLLRTKMDTIQKMLCVGVASGVFAPELLTLVTFYLDNEFVKVKGVKVNGFQGIHQVVETVFLKTHGAQDLFNQHYGEFATKPINDLSVQSLYDSWNRQSTDPSSSFFIRNLAPPDSLVKFLQDKPLLTSRIDYTGYGGFNVTKCAERERKGRVLTTFNGFRNTFDAEGFFLLRTDATNGKTQMGLTTDPALYQALQHQGEGENAPSPLQQIILGAQAAWSKATVGDGAKADIERLGKGSEFVTALEQAVSSAREEGTPYDFKAASSLAKTFDIDAVEESTGNKTKAGKNILQYLSFYLNYGLQGVVGDLSLSTAMAAPHLLDVRCLTPGMTMSITDSDTPYVEFLPPGEGEEGHVFAAESVGHPVYSPKTKETVFTVTEQALPRSALEQHLIELFQSLNPSNTRAG